MKIENHRLKHFFNLFLCVFRKRHSGDYLPPPQEPFNKSLPTQQEASATVTNNTAAADAADAIATAATTTTAPTAWVNTRSNTLFRSSVSTLSDTDYDDDDGDDVVKDDHYEKNNSSIKNNGDPRHASGHSWNHDNKSDLFYPAFSNNNNNECCVCRPSEPAVSKQPQKQQQPQSPNATATDQNLIDNASEPESLSEETTTASSVFSVAAATFSIDTRQYTAEFIKGFMTIAGITLIYASLAPLWFIVFQGDNTCPPLFLNATVSVVAFVGIVLGAPWLDQRVDKCSSALAEAASDTNRWGMKSFQGGIELGLWKFLGE